LAHSVDFGISALWSLLGWTKFGSVLERAGQHSIVEESTKDEFWSAKPRDDGTLIGMNVLGRLLMELRQQFLEVKSGRAKEIKYPFVPHFYLFGKPLEVPSRTIESLSEIQTSMFG
jgi:hypothetical protein